MTVEQLGNNAPDGAFVKGQRRQVISGQGATRVLLPEDSGALVMLDRAAGIVYTLPAPVAGMTFDFSVSVSGTGSYSIDTDAATTFIGGGLAGQSTTAGGADFFPATISSTVSIDLDATEAGEDAGGYFTMTAISSTVWIVGGVTAGSGTLITPFA